MQSLDRIEGTVVSTDGRLAYEESFLVIADSGSNIVGGADLLLEGSVGEVLVKIVGAADNEENGLGDESVCGLLSQLLLQDRFCSPELLYLDTDWVHLREVHETMAKICTYLRLVRSYKYSSF